MSASFKTCDLGHNILELIDILINFYFARSETKRDYYW